ncbi:hypothetical protein HBH98_035270 [Parastagonospora nodorum]|nr:hypothetical protein HBH49_054150 [Parastagonospora nodorum]KAH4196904.1 hypothetical protein HBH42_071640 [Parastagonospora nodorum]KAH4219835.1 hypothetical protein HBI06_185360 [Parastagonospora nodorum]KAH4314433.1 hypothetical protein HBI02_065340 [Parastagonospora nodorum]KAH4351890.1 hypothetical protein HBH98_035270 [Parastagonospora nodorum]
MQTPAVKIGDSGGTVMEGECRTVPGARKGGVGDFDFAFVVAKDVTKRDKSSLTGRDNQPSSARVQHICKD